MRTESRVTFCGLMPHPPIVVPLVGRGREDQATRTVTAMRAVARRLVENQPDLLVLISPHTPRRPGAFAIWGGDRLTGSLARFGAPQARVELPASHRFRDAIEHNLLQHGIATWRLQGEELDHGAVVPLWFLYEAGWSGKTVILGLNLPGEYQHQAIGRVIADTAHQTGLHTAIIASGDMSHRLAEDAPGGYHPRAQEFDRTFIDLVEESRLVDLDSIDPDLVDLAGQDVVESSVIACSAIGFRSRTCEVLSYEAPFGVGYGVAIFHDGLQAMRLVDSLDAGEILVATARRAVERFVLGGDELTLDPALDSRMPRRHGLFVTIRTNGGELRGCMGTIGPVDALFAETVDRAIAAAAHDPRFPRVTPEELPHLQYEVSLLHEPKLVEETGELDPARFGVIMRETNGKRRALLLPGIEGIDTVEQQLGAVRRKAGIQPGDDVIIHKFTVDKFEERPPGSSGRLHRP